MRAVAAAAVVGGRAAAEQPQQRRAAAGCANNEGENPMNSKILKQKSVTGLGHSFKEETLEENTRKDQCHGVEASHGIALIIAFIWVLAITH